MAPHQRRRTSRPWPSETEPKEKEIPSERAAIISAAETVPCPDSGRRFAPFVIVTLDCAVLGRRSQRMMMSTFPERRSFSFTEIGDPLSPLPT